MNKKTINNIKRAAGEIWPGKQPGIGAISGVPALGTWERVRGETGRAAWVFYPRMAFFCGLDKLPDGQREKAGRAAGLEWIARAVFVPTYPKPIGVLCLVIGVYYTGGIDAIASPGRLKSIVRALALPDMQQSEAAEIWQRDAAKQGGPDVLTFPGVEAPAEAPAGVPKRPEKQGELVEWIPAKGAAIIAASDKESSLPVWERDRQYRNVPMLAATLGQSTVRVLWENGKQSELKEPQTVEEVRQFLKSAFGGAAYGVLFALAYLSAQSKRQNMRVKTSELARMIFGERPASSQKAALWAAITALDCAKIEMSVKYKDARGKGERVYIFRFVQILEMDFKGERRPGEIPREIRLNVFPRFDGDPFGPATLALPESVFSLSQDLLPLASFLLMRQKQTQGGGLVKPAEKEVMRAAGLGKKYEQNPTEARTRLVRKIEALTAAGIVGPPRHISPGKVEIEALE